MTLSSHTVPQNLAFNQRTTWSSAHDWRSTCNTAGRRRRSELPTPLFTFPSSNFMLSDWDRCKSNLLKSKDFFLGSHPPSISRRRSCGGSWGPASRDFWLRPASPSCFRLVRHQHHTESFTHISSPSPCLSTLSHPLAGKPLSLSWHAVQTGESAHSRSSNSGESMACSMWP